MTKCSADAQTQLTLALGCPKTVHAFKHRTDIADLQGSSVPTPVRRAYSRIGSTPLSPYSGPPNAALVLTINGTVKLNSGEVVAYPKANAGTQMNAWLFS